MASSKPIKSAADRQWEIDDAVRTLQRAEAIRKDKFLMGGVKKSVESLNKMITSTSIKKPNKKK